MTQEEKELSFIDISGRLHYGICANLPNHHLVSHKYIIHDINIRNGWTTGILDCAGRIQIYSAKIEDIKPYLRPMSSMTEEERKEYEGFIIHRDHIYAQGQEWDIDCFSFGSVPRLIDWLNAHHFDYRGLIEKGLAVEVTENNNPYK